MKGLFVVCNSSAVCQPKAQELVSPDLSARPLHPGRHSPTAATAVLRMLPLLGGATLRMSVGGGSPTLRTHGAGTVKSSCSPGGPQVLGAPGMGLL